MYFLEHANKKITRRKAVKKHYPALLEFWSCLLRDSLTDFGKSWDTWLRDSLRDFVETGITVKSSQAIEVAFS